MFLHALLAGLIVAPCSLPQTEAPAANHLIVLPASSALVHGSMLRYEPAANKNCLGYWTEVEDWAEWTFDVPVAGSFELEVWQGCGKGHGGSDVRVEVAGQQLHFVVEDTGHFQNFTARSLGRVELPAGKNSLALKPQRKPAAAVMDVRRVRLLPVNRVRGSTAGVESLAGRVLFLGDSITYGGEWTAFVEAYLRLASPSTPYDFINLGLPSETVSGLSEPGHAGGKFPRPDLHQRLDRTLARLEPAVIVACYGMNDGIYAPFAEERFAKYQDGIRRLRQAAAATGASVIHLTPPVFDALPRDGARSGERSDPGSPGANYDEVLERYSAWLVAQRSQGWQVVDVHTPMARFLLDRRADDPRFRLAADGVHAGAQGHWLIAREFLAWAGVPPSALLADSFASATLMEPTAPEVLDLVQRRQHLLRDAWLSEVGHERPGLPPGRPLAEAERDAAALLKQLQR